MADDEDFAQKDGKKPYPSLRKLARKSDKWHDGREKKKG